MNPFLWLLWWAGALVLLTITAAIIIGVVRTARKPRRVEGSHLHWSLRDGES